MKSSLANKLAVEFINVLKYNPELSHDEKILSLELRLDQLINDVEKGCAEASARQRIIVDTRPHDLPALAELEMAAQASRGPAN